MGGMWKAVARGGRGRVPSLCGLVLYRQREQGQQTAASDVFHVRTVVHGWWMAMQVRGLFRCRGQLLVVGEAAESVTMQAAQAEAMRAVSCLREHWERSWRSTGKGV